MLLARTADAAVAVPLSRNKALFNAAQEITEQRKTQNAATLMQQVTQQLRSVEIPRIDDTLAALATAAAGR